MNTNFRLSDRENLSIWGLSDTHIGSANCNYEYIEYAFEKWRLKTEPRMIILNGDILEVASKHVGDSAFKQALNVNEQLDVAYEYLRPFKDEILGISIGNHEKRMVNEFDFNPNIELAKRLGIPYDHNIHETIYINGNPFNILAMHGRGSSSKDTYLLNKIERETAQFENDIAFYGHTHLLANKSIPIKTAIGEIKRRTFVATGHYLKYKDSYAEMAGLPFLPEAFSFVDINAKFKMNITNYYIDVEREDLLEL